MNGKDLVISFPEDLLTLSGSFIQKGVIIVGGVTVQMQESEISVGGLIISAHPKTLNLNYRMLLFSLK
jgi:hypothetical protein